MKRRSFLSRFTAAISAAGGIASQSSAQDRSTLQEGLSPQSLGTLKRNGVGAITRSVQSRLLDLPATPEDYSGGDVDEIDNTAALNELYAANPTAVYYPGKFYRVKGNFPRLNIPHSGPGAWSVDGQVVYVDTAETHGPATIYVDASIGDDIKNHGLSARYPFATLQRAFDSLPAIIRHQQTIVLAEGVYNKSSRPVDSMPRPSIFYPQGKVTSARTAQKGDFLIGMVVIRGQGVAKTFIEPNPSAGYVYGPYISAGTEIALEDLTVRSTEKNNVGALLTSHRNAYVHIRRVAIESSSLPMGVVCEAGGFVEAIDCSFTGATSYDLIVYAGSGVSIAAVQGESNIGKALVAGNCDLVTGAKFTGTTLVASTGKLNLTGRETKRTTVLGDLLVDPGGTVNGAYVDIAGNVISRGGEIRLSASAWSKTITMFGGVIRLDGAKSYLASANRSEVSRPLVLRNGAELIYETTLQLRNNEGLAKGIDYGVQRVVADSDGYSIPLFLQGRTTVLAVGVSGAKTDGVTKCTLGKVQNLAREIQPPEGAILYLMPLAVGVAGIELVNGETAIIPSGSVKIGGQEGEYAGATLVYSALASRWMLIGLGPKN